MLKNTSQLKASLEQFLGNAKALNESSAVADRECLHVEVVAQEFVVDFHEPSRGREHKLESDQSIN